MTTRDVVHLRAVASGRAEWTAPAVLRLLRAKGLIEYETCPLRLPPNPRHWTSYRATAWGRAAMAGLIELRPVERAP